MPAPWTPPRPPGQWSPLWISLEQGDSDAYPRADDSSGRESRETAIELFEVPESTALEFSGDKESRPRQRAGKERREGSASIFDDLDSGRKQHTKRGSIDDYWSFCSDLESGLVGQTGKESQENLLPITDDPEPELVLQGRRESHEDSLPTPITLETGLRRRTGKRTREDLHVSTSTGLEIYEELPKFRVPSNPTYPYGGKVSFPGMSLHVSRLSWTNLIFDSSQRRKGLL